MRTSHGRRVAHDERRGWERADMTARRLRRYAAIALGSALLGLSAPALGQSQGVDPEFVYGSAVQDMKAGKFAEACPKFAEARRLRPDSTPALIGLAQC